MKQAKTEDQSNCPESQQQQERNRSVKTQQRFAFFLFFARCSQRRPGQPRIEIKKPGKPELPRDAPGQNDGFKSLPKHNNDEESSGNSGEKVQHECSCPRIL